MRSFMAIVLAVIFGFLGALGINHIPQGLTALSNLEIASPNNPIQATASPAAPQDAFALEILPTEPHFSLLIPYENLNGSSWTWLTVAITNNLGSSLQLDYAKLTPELRDANGKTIKLQRHEQPEQSSCAEIASGKKEKSVQYVQLHSQDQKLQLRYGNWYANSLQKPGTYQLPYIYDDQTDGNWYADGLQPGKYQLRYIYNYPQPSDCHYPSKGQVSQAQPGIKPVVSNFVEIWIVPSVLINNTTAEADGFLTETLVPERVWDIPPPGSSAINPVKVGVRITNNTSTTRFIRYADSPSPHLTGEDGNRVASFDIYQGGTRGGCSPLKPGESATFSWDANLFWKKNVLHLEGYISLNNIGTGYYSEYQQLKPGKYKVGMNYFPVWDISGNLPDLDLPEVCSKEIKESMTNSPFRMPIHASGINPSVEVNLVQQSEP